MSNGPKVAWRLERFFHEVFHARAPLAIRQPIWVRIWDSALASASRLVVWLLNAFDVAAVVGVADVAGVVNVILAPRDIR